MHQYSDASNHLAPNIGCCKQSKKSAKSNVGAKYSHSSPVGAANIPVISVVPIIPSAVRTFQLSNRSSFPVVLAFSSFGFGGCPNHLGFQVVSVLGHNLLIMLYYRIEKYIFQDGAQN
jgi:hypothetical protein